MASNMQSAFAQQRWSDYSTLVIIIGVGYDYCLTFSKEVAYVWRRPWTWVSTLFLFIRYGGCLSVLTYLLVGSTFIPGPVENFETLMQAGSCKILNVLSGWANLFFWVGADMVMVLRLYAIYNRSRVILAVLLVPYIAQSVVLFVLNVLYSLPRYAIVSTVQIFDLTVCNVVSTATGWSDAFTIIQFILVAISLALVMIQFARESLQMYQVTRKWQLNRYMQILLRDCLLYFFITFLNNLLYLLYGLGDIPQGRVDYVLLVVANLPLYTLAPRFVMNIRELYALDIEGRRGGDIDVGFGLSSRGSRGVGSTTVGTIAFAEVGGIGGLNDNEETVVELVVEERVESNSRLI